ncbi:TPA: ead/Ea22-like family protein [Escherichia coli]|uniref:ead/Ea22-like family protein n=1 Tax=Escherichia coli TaxID=562 RepID=UPI0002243AFE|nr:ead/Ea22-like family protein [Escherichia coli]EGW90146.1 ead protein domain protein [Escherichia coli STEC_DG131-3]EEU0174479.1 ead/Ea22-like family protein [Escherichia coli]EEU0313804.1 ead/Ea22-like family protein [Escherichia coli]EEV0922197.1 ead/Ea22-like family protein [Escherichia coli]EEX3419187.1 ead/Ea22-like family protein [Escherichia coli]
MSEIDYQALRKAAQNHQSTLAWYQEKPDSPNAEQDCDAALAAFKREIRHREVDIIAGLLDELDEKQQYIKLRDQENEDIALTVGKLRVELEETKSKLNEQRVYYEGVIADGSKRIAELQTKSAPDSFGIIGENIRTQDNHITSDPMFCVYQKREIVVDADYDYDRIVWVDEDGNEANKRQSRRLELLHENFREPPEKWRRVAVKDIDEFVTCCFTEQGCKDYLAANGHNLRLPFVYVKSGFRNAEYIGIRNWLAGIRIKGE